MKFTMTPMLRMSEKTAQRVLYPENSLIQPAFSRNTFLRDSSVQPGGHRSPLQLGKQKEETSFACFRSPREFPVQHHLKRALASMKKVFFGIREGDNLRSEGRFISLLDFQGCQATFRDFLALLNAVIDYYFSTICWSMAATLKAI